MNAFFPRAQEIQPELRATNQLFQCTVAQKKGQAQRSTGYNHLDAQEYRFVAKIHEYIEESPRGLRNEGHENSVRRVCYRRCAPIKSGVTALNWHKGHTEKWLNVPYSLDLSRKLW